MRRIHHRPTAKRGSLSSESLKRGFGVSCKRFVERVSIITEYTSACLALKTNNDSVSRNRVTPFSHLPCLGNSVIAGQTYVTIYMRIYIPHVL